MPALFVLALGAAALDVGCEEKKPTTEPTSADGGASAEKYTTADPKLAKALQAVASASQSDNGPPQAGIFAPNVADKRHPKGSPTTVDLIAEGSDPKVSLVGTADGAADATRAASYGPAALELEMQMGPRVAMPTIDLRLSLGPAKKDDGGTEWLVADVKKTTPAKQQLGQLPPGIEKEIGSLDGTSIRIKVTADGRDSEVQTLLAKGARSDLERLVRNAAEALVFATVPLPSKPVGVGAQWIAETRMPVSGVDVIAYRAYRVKEVNGDRLRLTLDVKAYATGGDIELAGVPKDATLEQFDAQSQGEMELVRGESLARKSDVQQRLLMVFRAPGAAQSPGQMSPPGGGGGMMTAQLQSHATLVRGEDLRVTAK
jgi:hypothetical protein